MKPDILGFSFYTNEVPKVIKMIEFARKLGIKEIWGGCIIGGKIQ